MFTYSGLANTGERFRNSSVGTVVEFLCRKFHVSEAIFPDTIAVAGLPLILPELSVNVFALLSTGIFCWFLIVTFLTITLSMKQRGRGGKRKYAVKAGSGQGDSGGNEDADAYVSIHADEYHKNPRPFLTLYDGFFYGWECAKRIGDCRLLGYRKSTSDNYQWIDYQEVNDKATSIASQLGNIGYNRGDLVGIYSQTRYEWMLTFIACQFKGLTVVPLYDTFGEDAMVYVLNQTELKVIFVANPQDVRKLFELRQRIDRLRDIILFDYPGIESDIGTANAKTTEDPKAWDSWIDTEFSQWKYTLVSLKEFMKSGLMKPKPHEPPCPDDVFEICYTSGTTGYPKGAVYYNKAMSGITESIAGYISRNIPSTPDMLYETVICYLPLSHAYELAVECFFFTHGHKLGYFSGDARKLIEDVGVLQPSIMTAVPRVLTRLKEGIEKKTSRQEAGLVRSTLFNLGVRMSVRFARREAHHKTILDKTVFKKVQKALGKNLKMIFVGSSATHPQTVRYLRATLGCKIMEGYGQTESYGLATVQAVDDTSVSCIGPPIPSLKVKVVDIAEMKYFAAEGTGELCLKGENVIKEYFKQPEITAETIDADGWLHTGDVAKIKENGTVMIIDRLKSMFKLSQGEYVIPEKVESAYVSSKFISSIMVFGNPLSSCCVAVIFPDIQTLNDALESKKIKYDANDYNRNPEVKTFLMHDMEAHALSAGLKGFEKVKNIHISAKDLMEMPQLLTPTLKPRRHLCQKHYEREIEKLYAGVVDKPLN